MFMTTKLSPGPTRGTIIAAADPAVIYALLNLRRSVLAAAQTEERSTPEHAPAPMAPRFPVSRASASAHLP
jgi:hypothetical protein